VDSALYEARHSFVWNLAADMLPLLAPAAGERILDLGCGTGQLTAKIAESGASVLGLDRSPEMIGQARQNFPGLEFRLGDGANFSFPGEFDAVFSNAALHWIPEAENVIRSIASSLRPGGRFIAEFGGKRNVQRLLDAARTALEARGHAFRNPWYFPSIGEYSTLLERQGFEVRTAWHFDRLTLLDDGEDSMGDWIEMFGFAVLAPAPKPEWPAIIREMENSLRPQLYRDGRWQLDYVRLRITAEFMTSPRH
jgi:trans-aconitate methyltransferase